MAKKIVDSSTFETPALIDQIADGLKKKSEKSEIAANVHRFVGELAECLPKYFYFLKEKKDKYLFFFRVSCN